MKIILNKNEDEEKTELAMLLTKMFMNQIEYKDMNQEMVYNKILKKLKEKKYLS
ncbi:hypothetical protein [Inediibacterium massiliense]|uniref:hypothetical protein n=1 Tax=Inediibacterium massiliense TaxID=1658111 RepID=UPI0018FE2E7C|nr:hypothetical protein [Inediibacterium massiliense]